MLALIIIFTVGLLLLLGIIYYRVHTHRETEGTEMEISHTRTHRWWYDRAQKAKSVTTYYSRKSVQIFILTILRLGVMLTFFTRKYTIRLIEHIKEKVAPMPKSDGGISETPISQFLETLNVYKKKLREFHQELEENHEVKNEEEQLTEQDKEIE